MAALDLTPFGFTPTESAAYRQLLEDGPSSGYSAAKRLSIARANAYQALDGLVVKHAAELTSGEPRTYRAVQPQALLAIISRDSAARLATLEAQIGDLAEAGAPGTVPFTGDAEFGAVLMRTAVRQTAPVEFLGPAGTLSATLPVWRARHANGRPTRLWSLGPVPEDFPVPGVTALDPASVRARLFADPIVLLTPVAAILGLVGATGPVGHWTSEPAQMLGARGVLETARTTTA